MDYLEALSAVTYGWIYKPSLWASLSSLFPVDIADKTLSSLYLSHVSLLVPFYRMPITRFLKTIPSRMRLP